MTLYGANLGPSKIFLQVVFLLLFFLCGSLKHLDFRQFLGLCTQIPPVMFAQQVFLGYLLTVSLMLNGTLRLALEGQRP